MSDGIDTTGINMLYGAAGGAAVAVLAQHLTPGLLGFTPALFIVLGLAYEVYQKQSVREEVEASE